MKLQLVFKECKTCTAPRGCLHNGGWKPAETQGPNDTLLNDLLSLKQCRLVVSIYTNIYLSFLSIYASVHADGLYVVITSYIPVSDY